VGGSWEAARPVGPDGVGKLLDAGLDGGPRRLVEGGVLGRGPHRRGRAAPAGLQPFFRRPPSPPAHSPAAMLLLLRLS
jgi:hypothetical protein